MKILNQDKMEDGMRIYLLKTQKSAKSAETRWLIFPKSELKMLENIRTHY
jgi:hypothetical protein